MNAFDELKLALYESSLDFEDARDIITLLESAESDDEFDEILDSVNEYFEESVDLYDDEAYDEYAEYDESVDYDEDYDDEYLEATKSPDPRRQAMIDEYLQKAEYAKNRMNHKKITEQRLAEINAKMAKQRRAAEAYKAKAAKAKEMEDKVNKLAKQMEEMQAAATKAAKDAEKATPHQLPATQGSSNVAVRRKAATAATAGSGVVTAGGAATAARLKVQQMKLKGQLKELTATLGETMNPVKQKSLEKQIDALQVKIKDLDKKIMGAAAATAAAGALTGVAAYKRTKM